MKALIYFAAWIAASAAIIWLFRGPFADIVTGATMAAVIVVAGFALILHYAKKSGALDELGAPH